MNRHLSASHRVAKLAALFAVASASAWPGVSTPVWAQDEDLDAPAAAAPKTPATKTPAIKTPVAPRTPVAPKADADDDMDAAGDAETADTETTETETTDTDADAETETTETTTTETTTESGDTEAVPGLAAPSDEQKVRAAALVDEAITVASRNPEARVALARGAAALLPQLEGRTRQGLVNRWLPLVTSSAVPRDVRLASMSAFFDVAARSNASDDLMFARDVAMMLPDAAARAGAFLRLSEAAEKTNWEQAAEFGALAQRAARQEPDLTLRARALAFIATRLASLNPETREAAVVEASSQARLIGSTPLRDALLAEIVGAAAKFDIPMAQRISGGIENENYKNLATARIAVSQVQSTFAVKQPDADRIAEIVNGVQRYDSSFIPVLLQLPATPEVFQALGNALPGVYPGAPRAIDASTLERVWNFTQKAEPSVYRDQLQSRVARLMVLQDLWRGRAWGQQLAWQGGRTQIAQFVNSTVRVRESQLKSEPLRARAVSNLNGAIYSTRVLAPSERVESLLLIAGQVLGGSAPMPVA